MTVRGARREVRGGGCNSRTLRGLLAAGALSASLAAQQDKPVFRARTDLVRIDVVAVDAEGHAVHGLTRDDFEVLDHGRPQQVAAFEEISHTHATAVLPATLKLDVADNANSSADRLIILVLDDLHFQAKTGDVKAMARRVVTGIGPRASLALVTTSGVFGVEPTVDRAVVLSELDRFLDRFDPEMRRLAPGARMPNPPAIRNALGEPVTERGPANLGRFFGDMGTYKTVGDVAKKIGIDAGRRNALVWISGGMNAPRSADCAASDRADKYHCGALAGLLESLRTANVAAYGIATGDFSSGLLKDAADASGGFVMNAVDFDRDLPRLIDDLDHYYLIAFYPDDVSDRKFRPIEVRLRRAGLTVRYRRGYQPGETPKPRNAGALARMSEGVLPIADLPLRLTATPLPRAGKASPRTVIAVEIHAPRAPLADADGHLRDVLRYEVWAIDARKKKAVKSIAREAQLDLDPAEAAAAAGDPLAYQVHTALALSPGRYQLRASARSAKSGKGGSVFHEMEVPDFTRSSAVGAIVLAYASGPRVPIVRGGLGVALLPVAPTLDREFLRTDLLRVVCEIGIDSPGSGEAVLDLLRGSGEHVMRIATRAGSAKTSWIDATLSLGDLAPGGYRLRVTASAGAVTAQREAGFVVR